MKNLAGLQAECVALGISVDTNGRPNKAPYITALRDHHWRKDYSGEPLSSQIMPMLLGSWDDLDETAAQEIEQDCHAWIVQPKLDGVRALLHVEDGRVRITSRTVSEVTYRLSEFQSNLPHLTEGLSQLAGTIFDGELVCQVASIDTGSSTTASSLQATTAVLATSPDNARRIQESQNAHLRFYVFDVLHYCNQDVTALPLVERQYFLETAMRDLNNPFVDPVPSFVVNKAQVHHNLIAAGGEGTVWKKADEPYQPGRRVGHWVKRKRGVQIEAFVTGCKPGTPERGHADLIGAVEFSVRNEAGAAEPIAWVAGWSDNERRTMTLVNSPGQVILNPTYLGRKALIHGQDRSAKSRRIRHARFAHWLN